VAVKKKKRNHRDKIPGGLGDVLLAELLARNETAYRVCRNTGIDQATISRFLDGSRGMSLVTAEKLIEYLGFEIVKVYPTKT